MRTVILMIALVASSVSAHSKVAACSGSDALRWSNCFGTLTSPSGVKYVGEFLDGKYHGQGTSTFPDGRPAQAGIWENNRFVRAQPIPDPIANTNPSSSPTGTTAPRQVEAHRATLNRETSASSPDTNGVKLPIAVPPTSKVFVFMDTIYGAPPFLGAMVSRYDLKFDGVELPQIYGYKYLQFDVQPGTYVINAHRYGGDGTELRVTVGVNETQYVYVDPVGMPRPTPVLRLVNEARGQKGINISTPLQVPESVLAMFIKKGILVASQETTQRMPNLVAAAATPLLREDVKPIQTNQTDLVKRQQIPVQAVPPRSSLALSVSTSQPDAEGVVTLTITTNTDTASLKINGDEAGEKEDGRYAIKKFVQLGNNVFDVVATDRFGNTQRQSASVTRRAADSTVRFAALNPTAVRVRPATNAVAIIIGIQDYSRVPKAEFANNDARVFYDYAIRGLGVRPENIKILLDQEANDIDILGAFKNWLPLKTRKGQTDVYVFYSGHGLPSDDGSNLYVLPHGVDRQFLDRTAIKQSELIASLQAVSPRSVTMFMDACYSGQIRTGETLLASARPISIQSKASSYPANFNVISASAPDQLASSSPDLKHGMFSYFLMKGMEGEADENRDGSITMAEMQLYLKEYVGKKAMSLNRTQVPQLTGDQSRVLVSR